MGLMTALWLVAGCAQSKSPSTFAEPDDAGVAGDASCCAPRSAQRVNLDHQCKEPLEMLACAPSVVDSTGTCVGFGDLTIGCAERALADGGVEVIIASDSNRPASDFGAGFRECSADHTTLVSVRDCE